MNFLKKKHGNGRINVFAVSKKLILVIALIIGAVYNASAQDVSPHALGIRTGDNDGFNTEISYQRKIKDSNRFEVDLGYRSNKNFQAWKLSGIYQWVWNIDGGFNWYAGFGAGAGNWKFKSNLIGDDNNLINDDNEFFVNAAGNVGIEYNFDIPLLISLDFRPEIGLVNDVTNDDLDFDIALGLRYQF